MPKKQRAVPIVIAVKVDPQRQIAGLAHRHGIGRFMYVNSVVYSGNGSPSSCCTTALPKLLSTTIVRCGFCPIGISELGEINSTTTSGQF
jgi:hypothetical protein